MVVITHCVKSIYIQSFSGPCFPTFALNTGRYGTSPYSVQMRENTDKDTSWYFSRCDILKLLPNYSKYYFNNSISQNQNNSQSRAVKTKLGFIWPILWSLFYFYANYSKTEDHKGSLFTVYSIQVSIAFHAVSFSNKRVNTFTNLRNSPKKAFFTIKILHVTNEINEILIGIEILILWGVLT